MSRKGLTEDALKLAAEVSASGDMPPKLREPERLAREIIWAQLRQLDHVSRGVVINALWAMCEERTLMQKEIAALKAHNEQRHEEVWAARELLRATPDETLVMAVRRWQNHPCALGTHQYPPGATICTCGQFDLRGVRTVS